MMVEWIAVLEFWKARNNLKQILNLYEIVRKNFFFFSKIDVQNLTVRIFCSCTPQLVNNEYTFCCTLRSYLNICMHKMTTAQDREVIQRISKLS